MKFKMPARKILIGIILATSIISACNFLNSLVFYDGEFTVDGKIELPPHHTLVQKFTARRNNLQRVEIIINTNRMSSKNHLVAKLQDADCENVLREGTLRLNRRDWNDLYEMNFSSIRDSAGQEYCLKITYEATPGSSRKIKFSTGENPSSSVLDTFDGQTYENRSLAMRPAYKNDRWWQDVRELNQRISQYKPFFLKHYFLYAIAFGFILISLILAALLIII